MPSEIQTPPSGPEFIENLAKLAEICLTVGVNLQPEQELIINAPLEASTLVQQVVRIAYQRGAKLVTCLYDDPSSIRARLEHSKPEHLDHATTWLSRGVTKALEAGAARLFVVAPYPDLLSGVAVDRIVRVHAATGKATSQEMAYTAESRVNWSTVPFATASWARTVFPDCAPEVALEKLWHAVFNATRVHEAEPVLAWHAQQARLAARRDFLQDKRFSALRLYDGKTDLTVGLADGHRWVGGAVVGKNGVECLSNIPTEEVFSCPHRERTTGRMFLSKPLALGGTLVEDACVEFRDGCVFSVQAKHGQETLEKLLASDEGARRLGEVGLVPHSSPISASNILFYNALFDENAASHVAFGQSYAACLMGDHSTPEARQRAGANSSTIHIDSMLGSASMNVDGFSASGQIEPIMRQGEFLR